MDATHFKTTELIQRGGPIAVHGTAIEDADLSSSAPPVWVMLIPAGEFSGRDRRGPFRLADPARVIAATEALGLTAGVAGIYFTLVHDWRGATAAASLAVLAKPTAVSLSCLLSGYG
jgi:hypothetical protein